MAIKNPVLFGLKVANDFADILSKNTSLNNLGLDIRDLDVIRGIAPELDRIELQQVSGLDVNLTRFIDRLKSDTSQYSNLISLSSGYSTATRGNFEAYGGVSGSAIRFQYVPNNKGIDVTSNDLKYGDISTSRVSAWSGGSEASPTEDIAYGASVQVRGSLRLGQSTSFPFNNSSDTLLKVLDTPEPVRFPAEVPTEIIKITLNGADAYVYAMRGIPQIFTTAFKRLDMTFGFNSYVVDGTPLKPVYTFTDVDNGFETVSSPTTAANNLSRIRYNSSQFKERELRVYFPPKNITSIKANNSNLAVFPNVKYENLREIQLVNNILTSIPDFSTISYRPIYNAAKTEITSQISQLVEINLQNNRFYNDSDVDQRFLGSNTMVRLPSSLKELNIRGCYNLNTTFLDANDYLVIKARTSDSYNTSRYDDVLLDSVEKQEYTFKIGTVGSETQVTIKGIYFDKYFYDAGDANVSARYVYIKDPKRVGSTTPIESIANYQNQVEVLDFFTKTPNLESFNIQDSRSKRISRTNNSKYVDVYNNDFYGYINNIEITPRFNIRTLKYFNIYNCYFTKLNPIFENPSSYGLSSAESPLETFQAGENEALTTSVIQFNSMTSIRTIDIRDTALPIPLGLTNKTTLTTLQCSRTRFPTRNPVTDITPNQPGGLPEAQENYLWGNSEPTALTQYALLGCSNLRSLSFYASRLDGMIPKFVGNTNLTSIDFRNTRVEGGRPGGPTASFNNGEHGRRYIMWDDTFQDAQKVTSIRIFSNVLGRNIGTYTPGLGPSYVAPDGTTKISDYSGAEFQDGAFSLPLVTRLDIDTNGNFLQGSFFSTGGAPLLRELNSNGVGWGTAFADGTPFPSFNGNTNLYRIDLRNNKFKGNIALVNLSKLRYFYASSNIITGIGSLSNLGALNYFFVGNNQIAGSLPDFSGSAPNLQYISFPNNQLNAYVVGSLQSMTRIRSLDLSANNLNRANIDAILQDLLINYNNARRGGVLINLAGTGNASPTTDTVVTPVQSITKVTEESIVVNQPDPTSPITVFETTINLRNDTSGTAPNQTIYNTKLFIDGSEVIFPNAAVQIIFNTSPTKDNVTFDAASAPAQGTVLKLEVWRTVNGTVTTQTGAGTIVTELNSKGWTVQTNQ